MTTKEHTIMSNLDIERSLARIVLQIIEKNGGVDNIALIGIHTRGVYLAQRIKNLISQQENIDVAFGTLDITLYRDDWSRAVQNPMVKKTDINFQVEDYNIVLVDDVLFTGRTIRAAFDAIMDFGRPKSIQLAVLVDRKCGRELPIQPNFSGTEVLENVSEHVNVLLKEKDGKDEVLIVSTY